MIEKKNTAESKETQVKKNLEKGFGCLIEITKERLSMKSVTKGLGNFAQQLKTNFPFFGKNFKSPVDQAIDYFNEAIKFSKENNCPRAYFGLYQAYLKKGDFDSALKNINEAIKQYEQITAGTVEDKKTLYEAYRHKCLLVLKITDQKTKKKEKTDKKTTQTDLYEQYFNSLDKQIDFLGKLDKEILNKLKIKLRIQELKELRSTRGEQYAELEGFTGKKDHLDNGNNYFRQYCQQKQDDEKVFQKLSDTANSVNFLESQKSKLEKVDERRLKKQKMLGQSVLSYIEAMKADLNLNVPPSIEQFKKYVASLADKLIYDADDSLAIEYQINIVSSLKLFCDLVKLEPKPDDVNKTKIIDYGSYAIAILEKKIITDTALKKNKINSQVWLQDLYIKRGKAFFYNKRYADAIADFKNAFRIERERKNSKKKLAKGKREKEPNYDNLDLFNAYRGLGEWILAKDSRAKKQSKEKKPDKEIKNPDHQREYFKCLDEQIKLAEKFNKQEIRLLGTQSENVLSKGKKGRKQFNFKIDKKAQKHLVGKIRKLRGIKYSENPNHKANSQQGRVVDQLDRGNFYFREFKKQQDNANKLTNRITSKAKNTINDINIFKDSDKADKEKNNKIAEKLSLLQEANTAYQSAANINKIKAIEIELTVAKKSDAKNQTTKQMEAKVKPYTTMPRQFKDYVISFPKLFAYDTDLAAKYQISILKSLKNSCDLAFSLRAEKTGLNKQLITDATKLIKILESGAVNLKGSKIDKRAWLRDAYKMRGIAHYNTGEFAWAIEDFKKAIKIDEEIRGVQVNEQPAKNFSDKIKNIATGIHQLTKDITQDIGKTIVDSTLGNAPLTERQEFMRLLAQAHYQNSKKFFKEGDWQKSIENIEDLKTLLLSLCPENGGTGKNGYLEKLANLFETRSFGFSFTLEDMMFDLGMAYLNAKNYEKAISCFKDLAYYLPETETGKKNVHSTKFSNLEQIVVQKYQVNKFILADAFLQLARAKLKALQNNTILSKEALEGAYENIVTDLKKGYEVNYKFNQAKKKQDKNAKWQSLSMLQDINDKKQLKADLQLIVAHYKSLLEQAVRQVMELEINRSNLRVFLQVIEKQQPNIFGGNTAIAEMQQSLEKVIREKQNDVEISYLRYQYFESYTKAYLQDYDGVQQIALEVAKHKKEKSHQETSKSLSANKNKEQLKLFNKFGDFNNWQLDENTRNSQEVQANEMKNEEKDEQQNIGNEQSFYSQDLDEYNYCYFMADQISDEKEKNKIKEDLKKIFSAVDKDSEINELFSRKQILDFNKGKIGKKLQKEKKSHDEKLKDQQEMPELEEVVESVNNKIKVAQKNPEFFELETKNHELKLMGENLEKQYSQKSKKIKKANQTLNKFEEVIKNSGSSFYASAYIGMCYYHLIKNQDKEAYENIRQVVIQYNGNYSDPNFPKKEKLEKLEPKKLLESYLQYLRLYLRFYKDQKNNANKRRSKNKTGYILQPDDHRLAIAVAEAAQKIFSDIAEKDNNKIYEFHKLIGEIYFKNPDLKYELAITSLKKAKNLEAKIKISLKKKKSKKSKPNIAAKELLAQAYYKYGMDLMNNKFYQQAQEIFKKLIALLNENNQADKRALEKVIDKTLEDVFLLYANCMLEQGLYPDAGKIFDLVENNLADIDLQQNKRLKMKIANFANKVGEVFTKKHKIKPLELLLAQARWGQVRTSLLQRRREHLNIINNTDTIAPDKEYFDLCKKLFKAKGIIDCSKKEINLTMAKDLPQIIIKHYNNKFEKFKAQEKIAISFNDNVEKFYAEDGFCNKICTDKTVAKQKSQATIFIQIMKACTLYHNLYSLQIERFFSYAANSEQEKIMQQISAIAKSQEYKMVMQITKNTKLNALHNALQEVTAMDFDKCLFAEVHEKFSEKLKVVRLQDVNENGLLFKEINKFTKDTNDRMEEKKNQPNFINTNQEVNEEEGEDEEKVRNQDNQKYEKEGENDNYCDEEIDIKKFLAPSDQLIKQEKRLSILEELEKKLSMELVQDELSEQNAASNSAVTKKQKEKDTELGSPTKQNTFQSKPPVENKKNLIDKSTVESSLPPPPPPPELNEDKLHAKNKKNVKDKKISKKTNQRKSFFFKQQKPKDDFAIDLIAAADAEKIKSWLAKNKDTKNILITFNNNTNTKVIKFYIYGKSDGKNNEFVNKLKIINSDIVELIKSYKEIKGSETKEILKKGKEKQSKILNDALPKINFDLTVLKQRLKMLLNSSNNFNKKSTEKPKILTNEKLDLMAVLKKSILERKNNMSGSDEESNGENDDDNWSSSEEEGGNNNSVQMEKVKL